MGRLAKLLAAALAIVIGGETSDHARAGSPLTFERDVRPILKTYCLDCHGASADPKGKLDLRLKRSALKGGKSGTALVPGEPEESLLLSRAKEGEMPPGEKKVPAAQLAVIEQWIAGGAGTVRAEPESLPPGIDITPEERAYWAFQPIRATTPPATRPGEGARTPIDAFLLPGLRSQGHHFNPEADRSTLVKRASFDLTGLPPEPAVVDAYLKDESPLAYERMIDRLLASPQYGERWARHWLDVAGYADSEGNANEDSQRPDAYRYRDYVIRSFNTDKPLDQFVIEQLAGDELVQRPWTNLNADQIEKLSATGFLRMAVDGTATGGVDEPLVANQVVADTLKIVGSSFLGLTVGCAQCHDHRYDPIPQSDYYRLRAVFEPALDPSHWRRPVQRRISLYTDADRAQAAAIEKAAQEMDKVVGAKSQKLVAAAIDTELKKFPDPLRAKLRAAIDTSADKRSAEQKGLLAGNPSVNITEGVLYQYQPAAAKQLTEERARIAAKRATKPVEGFVSVLDELPGVVPVTKVFHRGDHRQPTVPVVPGDLTIVSGDGPRFEINASVPGAQTSGRRLAYAKNLVTGKHPLVGRVLMNRVWLEHFGKGLFDSPGDVGVLGLRPTHPELLDWLATELVQQGWTLKRMHRLIMTSAAYRQSSVRPTSSRSDADLVDRLYGRYPLRRLDAEALRDSILATSGRLDRTLYGRAIPVSEDLSGQVMPAGNSARRSIYLEVRRTRPVSLLTAFDAPVMAVNCDRRMASTSAPQSLMLMNSDFLRDEATAFAVRLRRTLPLEKGATPATIQAEMIGRAWRVAYQRPISPQERELAIDFTKLQIARGGKDPSEAATKKRELDAITNLCQQILSSNEFLYVD
jgi:mono/diheme cytochrome c family protein